MLWRLIKSVGAVEEVIRRVRKTMRRLAAAAILFGFAGIFALFGIGWAFATLWWGLAYPLGPAGAAAVTAAVAFAIALVFAMIARAKLDRRR